MFAAGCSPVIEAIKPEVTAVDGRPCPAVIVLPEARTAEIYRGNRVKDPASLRMSAYISGETLHCKYDNDFLETDVKVSMTAISGPSLADVRTAEVPFPYFMIVKDTAEKGGRVRAKGVYFLKAVTENGSDPKEVISEKKIRLPLYALEDLKTLKQTDLPQILIGFEGNLKTPPAKK